LIDIRFVYTFIFSIRCETIKQEYDRLLSNKISELNKLQSQVDELNEEINKIKQKYRKEIDTKDLELKTTKLNYENMKQEYDNNLNELKQMKTRFDTLKTKDKENQIEFEKSLSNLESENERLNTKYLDVSKELIDIQNKYEITKCQLAKYEQLIDSLNEQVILLKRENKEIQLNYIQVNQSLESQQEIRNKLEANYKELENQCNELKKYNLDHQNCENNISNLQIKIQQLTQSLETK
jgi:chromosome segregation ATPase